MIHSVHLGIAKTRTRANQVMYWINMSNDIKSKITSRHVCEKFKNSNSKEQLIPYFLLIYLYLIESSNSSDANLEPDDLFNETFLETSVSNDHDYLKTTSRGRIVTKPAR